MKHWFVAALMCIECFSANAAVTRQPAGACDVDAPQPETPGIAWAYWWSGGCTAGLASGPGYLFEYMKPGGFGDIYALDMVRGRASGKVTAYGSTFLGAEWFVQSGDADASGEWPDAWTSLDSYVPRYALPAPLQQAINRFAREVGHPQMPPMALSTAQERCNAEGRQAVRSHGDYDSARKAALEGLLQAAADNQDVQPLLRTATSIAGCRPLR